MKLGIALGSNLGDRNGNLRFGRERLSQHFGQATSAPVFETEPVDCPPGSEAFLNTVVEFDCDFEPLAILDVTQKIERDAGRIPDSTVRNAPRPLDVDILYLGAQTHESERLVIPHPRLHLRRFVLDPLAAIRPDLVLPGISKSIQQLLTDLKVEEPEPVCVARSW